MESTIGGEDSGFSFSRSCLETSRILNFFEIPCVSPLQLRTIGHFLSYSPKLFLGYLGTWCQKCSPPDTSKTRAYVSFCCLYLSKPVSTVLLGYFPGRRNDDEDAKEKLYTYASHVPVVSFKVRTTIFIWPCGFSFVCQGLQTVVVDAE